MGLPAADVRAARQRIKSWGMGGWGVGVENKTERGERPLRRRGARTQKKTNNPQTDGELGRRRNERRNLPSHLLWFHPRAATAPQTVWGHARVIIVFERDGRAVAGDCTL